MSEATMTPLDNDQTSTPGLTLATACTLLADTQRHAIIQYLTNKDTDIATLDELADHIQTEDDDVTHAKRARTILVHTHIPKLANHDVIEYDQRSETVRYQGSPRLESILAVAASDDRTY